jgi:hypothetical protein
MHQKIKHKTNSINRRKVKYQFQAPENGLVIILVPPPRIQHILLRPLFQFLSSAPVETVEWNPGVHNWRVMQ